MFHRLLPQDYPIVTPLVRVFDFNLIITAVLEQTSPGQIYVNDPAMPTTCFIVSAEGNYCAGDAHNAAFNAGLKTLIFSEFFTDVTYTVLECDTHEWAATFDAIFEGRVIEYPRMYYTFDRMNLDWQHALPDGFSFERVTSAFVERDDLKNMEIVRDAMVSNWNSADDFLKDGFGYCVVNDDTIVSWCMADCASGSRCEIGIHTDPHYQKRGFASLAVSAAVDHAVSRGLTEIGWHCWTHNLASRKVAEKVGFQFQRPYSAYLCLANEQRYLIERGVVAARQDDHRGAIGWYEQAGETPWAYVLAARSYAPLGEYPLAIRALQQAADLGWNYPDYLLADEFKPLYDLPEWKTLPFDLT